MRRSLSALIIMCLASAYIAIAHTQATPTFNAAFASAATPCPPGKVCTPNPNATPSPLRTPCAPTAPGCGPSPSHNPSATPTPCHPSSVTGQTCGNLPDLTARPPVRIGNPAVSPIPATTWGGSLALNDTDAIKKLNGRCDFAIWYEVHNIGTAPAAPGWKDVIKVDGAPVALPGPITPPALAPGASRLMLTHAVLRGGSHMLTLDINDPHVLTESNYANNHFQIHYTLVGNCAD